MDDPTKQSRGTYPRKTGYEQPYYSYYNPAIVYLAEARYQRLRIPQLLVHAYLFNTSDTVNEITAGLFQDFQDIQVNARSVRE